MTDEPSARNEAILLWEAISDEDNNSEQKCLSLIESALLSHGRRERAMGMREAITLAEQASRYGQKIEGKAGSVVAVHFAKYIARYFEHRAREIEGQA